MWSSKQKAVDLVHREMGIKVDEVGPVARDRVEPTSNNTLHNYHFAFRAVMTVQHMIRN